jgi:DNA repair protein RadC
MLLAGRGERLSDSALVGVVMGGSSGGDGDDPLHAIGSVTDVWRLTAEDLLSMPGVGPATAARVLAGIEFGRRVHLPSGGPPPAVTTPEDVVALCLPRLRGADREHFWALALNTKNRLLRIVEVSVGSLNASVVHPRELFKEAVRISAASLVVVHNHPSGDPTPSGADIQLTRRLMKAGDVLGIELLDHVVVGDGGDHASLRDLGLM